MLVLTRKTNESIRISDSITVTVLGVRQGVVWIGIVAPRNIPIFRSELSANARLGLTKNAHQSALAEWEAEGGVTHQSPAAA